MNTHERIVARVDAYLAASGMTPTAFGLAVNKDSGLVFRLRRGQVTLATVGMIEGWLDAQFQAALRRHYHGLSPGEQLDFLDVEETPDES